MAIVRYYFYVFFKIYYLFHSKKYFIQKISDKFAHINVHNQRIFTFRFFIMNGDKNNLTFICKIALLLAMLVLEGFYHKGYVQNKKAGEITRRELPSEKEMATPDVRSSFVSDTSMVHVSQDKRF